MANILVFGDSIAFGDYDDEGGWVDRLKRDLLASSIDHGDDNYVYNLAIDSETSKEILKRLENETRPRTWEGKETIFIFAFGINDSIVARNGEKRNKVPLKQFKSNLRKISYIASKYSSKIIFVGPTPCDEPKVDPMPWSLKESVINGQIDRYNKTLAQFCKSKGFRFLNLLDKLKNSDYMKNLYDGAHPNTKGHKKIYKLAKKFLKDNEYI